MAISATPADAQASGLTGGLTIYGDTRKVVERLCTMRVAISDIEFLPNCHWALYVRAGVLTDEQREALGRDFQVAAGRC